MNQIVRVIVIVGVITLAVLGQWNWAWLALGVAVFGEIGDIASALTVQKSRTKGCLR